METPSRHSFNLNGSTRVFPVASPIKGDNYCRIEVDGEIINDRSKYDIVNNSVVFLNVVDVPNGSQLDILVVQSEEAIGQLAITTNIDIVATNIDSINTVGDDIANVNTTAGSIGSVNTVATNVANVNTVAGSIANVNLTGASIANVNTTAGSIANVNTVGTNIASVNTVAGNNANVTKVANIDTKVTTVANNDANVTIVANDIASVNTTAASIAGVNTTAASIASVSTVASNVTNVNTVAGISGNVTTVAGIAPAVSTVSSNTSNVTAVAGISGNVTTVAGIASSVSTVATNNANVTAVAGNAANISAVAANNANVTAVANNATNINAAVANAANINSVVANETNVTAVATNASNINAAVANETNINLAVANETNISTVAGISGDVTTIATNIAAVLDAPNQATAAAASAVSAAASSATAAALLDNFDDRYLGPKTADPALDNDGEPLLTGALYFNTTDGVMKIYTTSGWIAASSASVATMATFEFVATESQTLFSGVDENGNSLSYTAPAVIVTLNGIRLRPGDDYTATSGVTLTLLSPATAGDELVIDAFGNFLIADTYSIAATNTLLDAKQDTLVSGSNIKTVNGESLLGASDIEIIVPPAFDSGTTMLFVQSTAPTGWTKSTTHDNKALRVVSGTAGSGGSAAFTTAFGTPSVSGSVSLSGTVGATTLTESQIPSHWHHVVALAGNTGKTYPNTSVTSTNTVSSHAWDGSSESYILDGTGTAAGGGRSSSVGGGGSHTHSFSGSGSLSGATAAIDVQYVDTIIAVKD